MMPDSVMPDEPIDCVHLEEILASGKNIQSLKFNKSRHDFYDEVTRSPEQTLRSAVPYPSSQ
jgi:hypothetical protein